MATKNPTNNLTPEGEPETPEEVEAARLAREARKNKGKNNPDPQPENPIIVVPDIPAPDMEPVGTDVTSIRTATPEDPNGEEEILIINNPQPTPAPSEEEPTTPEAPVNPSESPVEPTE